MGSLRRILFTQVGLTLAGLTLIGMVVANLLAGTDFGTGQQMTLIGGVSVLLGAAILWTGPVSRRPKATYWICLGFAVVTGIVLAVWNITHLATAQSSSRVLVLLPSALFVLTAAESAWRSQADAGASPELWFGTDANPSFAEHAGGCLRFSALAPERVRAAVADALRAGLALPQ